MVTCSPSCAHDINFLKGPDTNSMANHIRHEELNTSAHQQKQQQPSLAHQDGPCHGRRLLASVQGTPSAKDARDRATYEQMNMLHVSHLRSGRNYDMAPHGSRPAPAQTMPRSADWRQRWSSMRLSNQRRGSQFLFPNKYTKHGKNGPACWLDVGREGWVVRGYTLMNGTAPHAPQTGMVQDMQQHLPERLDANFHQTLHLLSHDIFICAGASALLDLLLHWV